MSEHEEVVAALRELATFHSRKAHELQLLAFKIEEPPEGVRVEIGRAQGGHDLVVRFVGPPV